MDKNLLKSNFMWDPIPFNMFFGKGWSKHEKGLLPIGPLRLVITQLEELGQSTVLTKKAVLIYALDPNCHKNGMKCVVLEKNPAYGRH